MKIKQALKSVLPPVLTQLLRKMSFLIALPDGGLAFAPAGWRTDVPGATNFASAQYLGFLEREWLGVWAPLIKSLTAGGIATENPGNSVDVRLTNHNTWMTLAYVLSRAALHGRPLKILDYGAGLGHCHGIARALLPEIPLEYHCKELPAIASLGRKFTPDATWHADESCLDAQYDLLILGSVLQYIEDWPNLLRRTAAAARHYVYITQTPVVELVPGYVAIQDLEGRPVLHNQINKAELLAAISKTGMRIVREFVENPHTRIQRAPEQPAYFGCLLERSPEAQ